MKIDAWLKDHERLDDLHRNGYRIIQDPKGFCFGADAVLLSGFARVRKGENVLDMGTGTGIIPILLEARTEGAHFTGLEIQEESVDMARRSVAFNALEDKIDIVFGDIKQAGARFGKQVFDVVTSNPPYMNAGGGLQNAMDTKAVARHEILCTLEEIIAQTAEVLRVGGRFYMVHRPHRLADIFVMLRAYKLEPKRLRMVHSYEGKAPSMVLVEAVKGGRPFLKVDAPLVIYRQNGEYTQEIMDIYYGDGKA